MSADARSLLDGAQRWEVCQGDTLEVLPRLPDLSVDAVVTDPPYGIDFKGAAWDGADIRRAAARPGRQLSTGQAFEAWTEQWAVECLRLLKPGGHIAAFCSPRTFHRLASGIENAGFELRDTLMWLHGQGMPKSRRLPEGRGTTLKPAFEPIVLARKPLEATCTQTIERWGTGTLNIDATRIADTAGPVVRTKRRRAGRPEPSGRWPANVVLTHARACETDHCAPGCPVAALDRHHPADEPPSRFFYCGKAGRRERDAGCEHLDAGTVDLFPSASSDATADRAVRNVHPTVKPLALMRWLTRLVVPVGGLVLDPFCGSGTTGAGAVQEQRRFYGIEREAPYVAVARARIAHWATQPAETDRAQRRRVTRKPRRRGDP